MVRSFCKYWIGRLLACHLSFILSHFRYGNYQKMPSRRKKHSYKDLRSNKVRLGWVFSLNDEVRRKTKKRIQLISGPHLRFPTHMCKWQAYDTMFFIFKTSWCYYLGSSKAPFGKAGKNVQKRPPHEAAFYINVVRPFPQCTRFLSNDSALGTAVRVLSRLEHKSQDSHSRHSSIFTKIL